MRCECCNVLLTTQESTRKFKTSGEYVDMCNKCLHTIDDEVSYTEGNTEDEDFDDDSDNY